MGSANIPSDFSSRNAPDCNEPTCQICSFIIQTEESVVRSVYVKDILDNTKSLPFTTRSAWIDIQSNCPELRRTHAHLKQGYTPIIGWSGGAMVLGKLPVSGRPTILITVGQGPIALAVGAGGGGLDIFTLIYTFSSFSLSLGDGSI